MFARGEGNLRAPTESEHVALTKGRSLRHRSPHGVPFTRKLTVLPERHDRDAVANAGVVLVRGAAR